MIRLAENTITHEELLALSEWIPNSPQLTKGPLVVEFEKKFASFTGTKHCVMVNSGSSANLLMAYSLLEGDYLRNKKVVVPAISWITTLSPFLQFGFEVLLCDSNNVNLGLDTVKLEEIFIKEKPALLILVHVLAHLNDMEEINRLCEKYDVLLIEDACEALGTSDVNGKKAGNLSLAGSFSFYYGHHISTIEGGAVTTNDTKLYNLMLSIRSHGWSRDVDSNFKEEWKKEYNIDDVREFYTFYYPGFNLRSTDLNAFIGISQLDKMEEIQLPKLKKLFIKIGNIENDNEFKCMFCNVWSGKNKASLGAHMRNCKFNIKNKNNDEFNNGIDPNLVETSHPETIIDNIQLTIPQTLDTTPAVKERPSRKTKK